MFLFCTTSRPNLQLVDTHFYETYRDDWARVRHANVVLDPSERSVRLTAEDIVEQLHAEEFDDIETKDSHLGNCATIWAAKASNK